MAANHYRSFVVRYHYRRAQLLGLSAVIALIAGLYGAYALGRYIGYSDYISDEQAADSSRFNESQALVSKLEDDLAVQQTRHDIDRATLELLRKEMTSERALTADLEEGLRFYKSLMAPGEIAQGLSLRNIELVRRDGQRRYAFRIVAQQEARKHSTLKGELTARVFGLLQGEERSYALAELSDDLDEERLTLRFRYFQAIEGELTLPLGFEPRGVSVVATAFSPRKVEVSEQFDWLVQEKFTHVGK